MKRKTSAHYQREYRRRLREQGLIKKEVWILPENAKLLAAYEQRLRAGVADERDSAALKIGESNMSGKPPESRELWTTTSLLEALQKEELVVNGSAKIELIDGIEPTLYVEMKEYGDLPIFLTVSGDQIIAESLLWSVDDVKDPAGFNEAVLRTHKYFPLSTISLDKMGEDGDYYQMFGALSSASLISHVVFEIEILASNVMQATEAYGEFLSIEAVAG